MNKRKILWIFICIFAGILILTGCQSSTKVDPTPDIHVKRDLTADPPVRYDVPDNAKSQSIPSILDYAISSDVSAISEASSVIVRGVVQEVTFTSYSGNAFTAVSFAVDECYKGNLQQGDLITILHRGGYIPLQDHIAQYNDAFRFEELSNEEIANTILHEVYEGESDPQIGDHNIYFLNATNSDSGLPTEAYQRTRGISSLFRVEPDGETVSRRNYDMYMETAEENPGAAAPFSAQNGTDPYGNETFSLQEIVDIACTD